MLPVIKVKSEGKLRLRQGHRWVFSNELWSDRGIAPGSQVEIRDGADLRLGWGYYNPRSLIALRRLDDQVPADPGVWLRGRMMEARQRREAFYPGVRDLRWIYSESDGLPGLVVDQYGDYLVVQINTAGMERMMPELIPALADVFQPRGIAARSDQTSRELEGLSGGETQLWGEPLPDSIMICENGLAFAVNPLQGQKTGFYYDQKDNRMALRGIIRPGMEVLDLFSYSGAWGLNAMAAGAGRITLVDRSPEVRSLIETAVRLNFPDHPWEFIQADVVEQMKRFREEGRRFDCVILDPPAFIKNRKLFQEGKKGYHQINQLGLRLVKPGGILVSCSCSHHLSPEDLAGIVRSGAGHDQRRVYHLFSGHQALDHPVLVTHPETAYLKCLFYQAL
ncbi:MAG: class I SAM-dependent rRNA methyltransferase [Candidatus Delongbacteria bacterium]|nr:class I SAM-dependent rRNA methyltransferase [Candidatus Delongbacteria bacterium]